MDAQAKTHEFASRVEGATNGTTTHTHGHIGQFLDQNAPLDNHNDPTAPNDLSPLPPASRDRRLSKEWDASKVPPSRFQKKEGSIYATPGSRDGHTKGKERDEKYFDKLKEKGWGGGKKEGKKDKESKRDSK